MIHYFHNAGNELFLQYNNAEPKSPAPLLTYDFLSITAANAGLNSFTAGTSPPPLLLVPNAKDIESDRDMVLGDKWSDSDKSIRAS